MDKLNNKVDEAGDKPTCSWPFNMGGESPVSPIWTSLYNGAKYLAILCLAVGVLMLAILWLVNKAFNLPAESFYQELCVVSASGIATFLATPVIIKASAKHRWAVLPLTLFLAAACIVIAFLEEGVLRALLIEATIALLLITGLELMFHQFVHVLHARYKAAEQDLEEEREWNQDFPFGPPRKQPKN